MTSYIAITDAETDPEAPLTSELAKKWRDNAIAIGEGDASVPANLRPTVLLGTINTTSGTSQTLSGLVLTPYKHLFCNFPNITYSTNNSILYITSSSLANRLTDQSSTASPFRGSGYINLSTGMANFTSRQGASSSDSISNCFSIATSYFTTSTSITFTCTSAFTTGYIQVWGIK